LDGKSLDQRAPTMRAVPGIEDKGRFVFDNAVRRP
jgi:hypothetical protein